MPEEKQEFPLSFRGETLPTTIQNRVLVLGSRLNGAFELGEGFQAYLEQKGIPEPSVEVLRDAGRIEEAILDIEKDSKSFNLPKGVILLPEMRQYSPTGLGMSLNTYESGISAFVKELCDRYGIPLVEVKKYESSKQIEEGLKRLLELET